MVCIGSPHHGAALERFGFHLQDKLGRFPFVKIIGHIVNIRSNGILDLRHGSVRDDDWEHNEARIGHVDDNRKPAPLTSHINTFLVAGTIEFEHRKYRALNVIGDYLVSVKSALGEHMNPRFQLKLDTVWADWFRAVRCSTANKICKAGFMWWKSTARYGGIGGKTAGATCTKYHAISQLQHGSSYFSQWA